MSWNLLWLLVAAKDVAVIVAEQLTAVSSGRGKQPILLRASGSKLSFPVRDATTIPSILDLC